MLRGRDIKRYTEANWSRIVVDLRNGYDNIPPIDIALPSHVSLERFLYNWQNEGIKELHLMIWYYVIMHEFKKHKIVWGNLLSRVLLWILMLT